MNYEKEKGSAFSKQKILSKWIQIQDNYSLNFS